MLLVYQVVLEYLFDFCCLYFVLCHTVWNECNEYFLRWTVPCCYVLAGVHCGRPKIYGKAVIHPRLCIVYRYIFNMTQRFSSVGMVFNQYIGVISLAGQCCRGLTQVLVVSSKHSGNSGLLLITHLRPRQVFVHRKATSFGEVYVKADLAILS